MVFPYPKGLILIKEIFSYILFRYLYIYCDILYSGIWFLTSGIRELSLAKEREKKTFLFCIIFLGKKKRATHTSGSYMNLYEMNLEKKLGILITLGKIPNFKKQISRNGVREVKL
jgi:hypothetical protein